MSFSFQLSTLSKIHKKVSCDERSTQLMATEDLVEGRPGQLPSPLNWIMPKAGEMGLYIPFSFMYTGLVTQHTSKRRGICRTIANSRQNM